MSALGDAVAALVALWRDAMPNLQVLDGPPVTGASVEPQALAVGHTEDADADAISVRPDPGDLGMSRDRLVAEISCVLRCWSGDADMAALRETALGLLADLVAALRADPKLGRKAMNARPYSYGVNQAIPEDGHMAVTITFVIRVELSASL
jgi:hypothetical protein